MIQGSVISVSSCPKMVLKDARTPLNLEGFLRRNHLPLGPAASFGSPPYLLRSDFLSALNGHKPHSGTVRHRLFVACCKEEANGLNSWPPEAGNANGADHRAVETVLRLYNAIKNRNQEELSEIIADECRCISNFVSSPFQGKKQVMKFFHYLMNSMGPMYFEIRPTFVDGLDVGVTWKFEWEGKHVPFGEGYAFYTCQTWNGKAYIKNVEMFIQPLFSFGLVRLKALGFLLPIFERLSCRELKPKETAVLLFFFTFLVVLLLSKSLFM